jgi:hypothetical protein
MEPISLFPRVLDALRHQGPAPERNGHQSLVCHSWSVAGLAGAKALVRRLKWLTRSSLEAPLGVQVTRALHRQGLAPERNGHQSLVC